MMILNGFRFKFPPESQSLQQLTVSKINVPRNSFMTPLKDYKNPFHPIHLHFPKVIDGIL